MAANDACNTSGRPRWTEAMEDLLVHCWQQYECLYNVSSDTFHNKAEKERCWEEIAVGLDLPVEEVKVRAASLRTQYSRLLKPLRGGRKNKAMTPRQRRILRSLKFLKKHVIPRCVPVLAESSLDQSTEDMLTTRQDSDDLEPENTAFSLDLDSGRSRSPAENVAGVRTMWSVKMEDKFLELWRQHKCLYNFSTDRFGDKSERERKWAEIAAALELPVEDVKMRACTLRTQYSRLVKPRTSGTEMKPLTERQRRIVKSCEFLKQYIHHRSTEDNLDQWIKDEPRTEQDSTDIKQEDTELSPDLDGEATSSSTDCSSVSPPPPPPPPPPPRPRKQPQTQNTNDMERQKVALLEHMLDAIQETSRQPERDCEDSFGVTVAMELKRIRNPALRNRVKRHIMTILYDALDSEQVTDPVSYQPQHTFPGEDSHSITVVIP